MAYDESGRAARCRVVTALLAVALIALIGANLCIGSVLVPADHIPGILSGGAADSMESQVIWEIRLPRVLSAILLGGALSLSGFLLQTFFNNPIADPFILGVSSGAKFVVALTMIVLLGANQAMSSPAMVVAAFLGSLITIGFVLLIARRISSMAMLIVAGVMVGYICSAATNFLIAFADDQSIVNLHNWSLGSFSGSSWDDVAVIAVVLVCVFLGFFLKTRLGLAIRATGNNPDMVRSSSINPAFTTIIGLCISNALTALSGCLLAQSQKSVNIDIGSGMVTVALASLLIGHVFLGRRKLPLRIFGMVLGAFVFRLVYTIALRFDMPAFMLKFVSAVVVVAAISIPYLKEQLPMLRRRAAHNRARRA